MIYLLTRRPRYFYNYDAVREPCSSSPSALRKMAEGRARLGGIHKDSVEPNAKASRYTHIGRERGVGNGTGRNLRNVWLITPESSREYHFAQFPRKLADTCIRAGCPPGGIVLDPFVGTGTTALAAAALDRRYIGIDLNADYCQIARRRLKDPAAIEQAQAVDLAASPLFGDDYAREEDKI